LALMAGLKVSLAASWSSFSFFRFSTLASTYTTQQVTNTLKPSETIPDSCSAMLYCIYIYVYPSTSSPS
jgi:hypothetical protein